MAESIYTPPGVYVNTTIEPAPIPSVEGLRIPVLIGVGQENLTMNNLEVVRGSSALVDQLVPSEDATGRAVLSVNAITGAITLGDFDGSVRSFRTRNYPITDGVSGIPTTDPASVSVTVNGIPALALSVNGTTGVIELSAAPPVGAEVLVTYAFDRTDTQETDDVSSQVTETAAIIDALTAGPYVIVAGQNDTLILSVNGGQMTPQILPAGTWTASQFAAIIQSAFSGVTGSAYLNNFGLSAVRLSASQSLTVGTGSTNNALGLFAGQATSRNATFTTFQGPITDGSNSGITTTDPTDVTVTVNGTAVVPVSVDGANRTVTLPYAPASGSTVLITYFWNAWQDTFDYLANINVVEITECGIVPNSSDFIEEADFVLDNDKIVWGAAALVSPANTSGNATEFNAQIATTLVDQKTYFEPCARVVNTTSVPPRESKTQFRLAFQPTVGNGRDTPLSLSQFTKASNGRVDVPNTRPDLITVYWGYGAPDALERGPVSVTAVDPATSIITLADEVPAGATVYATFYYNTLQDAEYDVVSVIEGPSGVGQYRVLRDEVALFAGSFGTKGASLATVAVEFPSGSELTPDIRFESNSSTLFEGPVSEVVTVQFEDTSDSPAIYTLPGVAPYYTVNDGGVGSYRLRLTVDSATLAGAATGINLSNPHAFSSGDRGGVVGVLVGDVVTYNPDNGSIDFVIDSTNNELNLTLDGAPITVTLTSGLTQDLGDVATDINAAVAAVPPTYTAAGSFSSFIVSASEFDQISFEYVGDVSGASGSVDATLTPGTYATPALLAAEVETQLQTEIATLVGGDAAFTGLDITVAANSAGQLVFTFTRADGDATGYWNFLRNLAPAEDFCVAAGIDAGASTLNGQVVIYDAPVAFVYQNTTSPNLHDRLILRSRVIPGSETLHPAHVLRTVGVVVTSGSALETLGLTRGQSGTSCLGAVVQPATLLGVVGWDEGQTSSGQPLVNFYDGTGANTQNNIFSFTFDGTAVTTTFTASSAGTPTALGPLTTSGTILNQIAAAMVTAGLYASVPAINSAGVLRPEGAGIRIISDLFNTFSRVEIGSGSANGTLGFSSGDIAQRSAVTTGAIVSALMNHSNATVTAFIEDYLGSPSATYFATEALAYATTDEAGDEFLTIQSNTSGTASNVTLLTATANDANATGTNLLGVSGTGAVGESGFQGFFVTSSNSEGSGSANTSVLNDGVGQDGIVGQTYRDAVTGLTFTVLPRAGALAYPTGSNATFQIEVGNTLTVNANLPVRVVPGVEMVVSNTSNVPTNDSALLRTFDKSGNEPSVGDAYYVSYVYRKSDISSTKIFTTISAVEAEFGPRSIENPLSLAAYLMFLNGASVIAFKQVVKDEGSGDANQNKYVAALTELEGRIASQVPISVLVPLTPATAEFAAAVSQHCKKQSSERFKNERTANLGFAVGTEPSSAAKIARATADTRVRFVYPDVLTLQLVNALGATQNLVVDGRFMAAAWTGKQLSAVNDVATPWTNQTIAGFTGTGRNLLDPDKDRIAEAGISVVEFTGTNLRIRHGLTSDMSNILTQLPTVAQISDEVQQRTRRILQRYVGIKYLTSVTGQIEGDLSTMFRSLIRAQVITDYTRVTATPDPTSPVTLNVEGYYRPVFPLLYLVVRYFLRS